MLRLTDITKNYEVADTTVRALKKVNLSFRKNEFVSILGPSGCGKTTLLNLIGGLDKYTSGDLFIGGTSTKKFKDADWDIYRNHRVGFIFQSYNLIPHQSVLGNVELALTIGGISKAERVERAKRALDKVGLSDQYYKKPNQLSGGQCQRVAIARALVNDPEVLLADEPTGALDTKTSVQIMDLIKEIAKDRLVIMVTHNPDLANQYSTRIVRLLDGEVESDSNPFHPSDEIAECEQILAEAKSKTEDGSKVKKERAKMSFFTAFRLSLQNLFTKKARTIMTSVAGSIGIIGISLVLSISYGVQSFINNMQNDMLSGNPITVSQSTIDLNALMQNMNETEQIQDIEIEDGKINVQSMIENLVNRAQTMDNMFISNSIDQDYIDFINGLKKGELEGSTAAVFFDYGLDVTNNIYTNFYETKNGQPQNISLSAIQTIYTAILGETEYADYSSMIATIGEPLSQALDSEDYIKSQYDFVTRNSRVAKEKNEVMIVLDEHGQLTDLLLAQLGFMTQEQFVNEIYKVSGDNKYDPSLGLTHFAYDDLMGKRFVWYPNDTVFNITQMGMTYNNKVNEATFGTDKVELEVVGILRPKEGISYGCLQPGFYYTEKLADYIIDRNYDSQMAKNLRDNDEDSYTSMIMTQNGVDMPLGITYTFSYTFEGETKTKVGLVGSMSQMSAMLGSIPGMGGSSSPVKEMYTLSLQDLGGSKIPYRISIYPTDFETKDTVLAYLDLWNAEGDITINAGKANEKILKFEDRENIIYNDTLSIIIAMIKTFINVITIALIGFTALSLVVSCVMIGIITYVSVVERVKEIGIIRSLGGRKKDVSYLFNAETFIIGSISGIIGISFTLFASAIINAIVNKLAEVPRIAIFPLNYAIIMMSISIGLTLISGLLPSRSAAKKDPVVALRSE